MKILLLTQYFWPETFPINALISGVVKLGHVVDVLTGQPNYPGGKIYPGYFSGKCTTEEYKGAVLHRVPILPRSTGIVRLALNYLSFIISSAFFAPWLLRKRHVDVILVYAPSPLIQTLPAIFLGWLRAKPVVLWVQDLWPESLSATGYVKNRAILKSIEYIIRFIYRHVDLILVQSEAFKDPVQRLAHGRRVICLPNSVDPSFEKVVDFMPDSQGKFTVLFAGNLGMAQALDTILATADLLRGYPDISIKLAGDGSRAKWLSNQVAENKLNNVELLGARPIEAMPQLMQQADALLVTLRAKRIFDFTVPSKVQAYMASGRPIIAAINGETARIIRESGAGLAVPAEDPQAIASAILELRALSHSKRAAIGSAGYLYYLKHYSEELVVNNLIEYLMLATREGVENDCSNIGR
jgi:glycosyltransferase involved in cell wall biosynthesis